MAFTNRISNCNCCNNVCCQCWKNNFNWRNYELESNYEESLNNNFNFTTRYPNFEDNKLYYENNNYNNCNNNFDFNSNNFNQHNNCDNFNRNKKCCDEREYYGNNHNNCERKNNCRCISFFKKHCY